MFGPYVGAGSSSDYPRRGSFPRESDWHILAGFWHPVAFSHELRARPLATRLLDIDLVVYRSDDGVTVARDRCPHRGVRLSGGSVRDGRLVCPMHGMHFDGAGRVCRIPSLPDQHAPLQGRAGLQTYLAEELYGLVWVCLKPEPIWPLPDWDHSAIADPGLQTVYLPTDVWRTSAARHVENFNDLAHFPWVHGQSFGNEAAFVIPEYRVEDTEYGLRFAFPYTEGGNRFPDGVDAAERRVVYRYEMSFPFATLLTVAPQESAFVHYFADVASPLSAYETRVFQLLSDSDGVADPAFWIADSLQINAEDKPLVESQPYELPLDRRAEQHHLPADRWSLRYRRALVERFGLGTPRAGG